MGDSFEDTVDQLAQQIQDIGYKDTHVEQLPTPPEPDAEADSHGGDAVERRVILVNAAAGPDFVLFASEDERYVEVQSSYPLWRDIANAISEERAEELVSDDLIEDIPEEHPIRSILPPDQIEDAEGLRRPIAALELLERANADVRKEIVYQLSEIFTNAETKHVVDSPSDNGAPHGFNVYYKIFPYEDEFSIRELNEVVERVRMAAHRGTLFLRYAFNLGVDISRTTAGDIEGDPSPPTGSINPGAVSEAGLEDID
jgi:hypothetical protein